MIVLDASLMIEWLATDDIQPTTFPLHEILSGSEILAPSHWPVEISNFLRTELSGRRMTPYDIRYTFERLAAMKIKVDPPIDIDDITPLAIFASKNGLTAYDAAYVQLALHRRAALATLDNAMRQAAQRLAIPLLPP